MNKKVKGIVIAAGVIALAVFYMLYADGRALFQKEDALLVSNGTGIVSDDQGETSLLSTVAATGVSSKQGESDGQQREGFSDQEKEEIRQIVEACISEQLKNEIGEAVKESLKESLDEMLENGQLEPAVENYLNVQSALVNINTADQEKLMSLPGIGQAKASAIIAYREENGSFSSLEQLTNVSGISANLLEKIRDQITL